MSFERKEWKKGDQPPGASDLNRIEGGIEQALASGSLDLEALNAIDPLPAGAKAADLVVAFNTLLGVLQGAVVVNNEVTTEAEGDQGQTAETGTES